MSQEQQVKDAQALKSAQDLIRSPYYADRIRLAAEIAHMQFKAFERAGFNPAQALELVVRRGMD